MSFPTQPQDNVRQTIEMLAADDIPAIDRIRLALEPGKLPAEVLEDFIAWCLEQARLTLEPHAPAGAPDPWDFAHIRRSLLQTVWERAASDPVAGWTAAWYAVWNADNPSADNDASGAVWLAAWATAWEAAKSAVRQAGPSQRPSVWATAWTSAWTSAWEAQVIRLLFLLDA